MKKYYLLTLAIRFVDKAFWDFLNLAIDSDPIEWLLATQRDWAPAHRAIITLVNYREITAEQWEACQERLVVSTYFSPK